MWYILAKADGNHLGQFEKFAASQIDNIVWAGHDLHTRIVQRITKPPIYVSQFLPLYLAQKLITKGNPFNGIKIKSHNNIVEVYSSNRYDTRTTEKAFIASRRLNTGYHMMTVFILHLCVAGFWRLKGWEMPRELGVCLVNALAARNEQCTRWTRVAEAVKFLVTYQGGGHDEITKTKPKTTMTTPSQFLIPVIWSAGYLPTYDNQ